ncbi:MAG TPA: porin family protein [Vicinamibacterales bacterium]|nr:porin family protein [Vicinamibacterales bacterium]
MRLKTVAYSILVGVMSLAFVPVASAQDGAYVRVDGGFQHRARAAENAQTYTDWDNGFAIDAAVGYETKSRVSFEGEYSYLKNNDKTTASAVTGPAPGLGNVSLDFFMGNVRYDAPVAPSVDVYVSGGLGGYKSYLHGISNTIAHSFGIDANGSNDGVVLAWQVRAGLEARVTPHVGVLVGYRYLHGNDLLFKGTAFGDLMPNGVKINAVEAGVRIKM